MKKSTSSIFVLFIFFMGLTLQCYSKNILEDSIAKQSHPKWSKFWTEDKDKPFKNMIKFNLTNPMIFGQNYNVIGYERSITNHQTTNIFIGRFSIPKFSPFNQDYLNLHKDSKDKGFTFAIDYRFYLKNENKYHAPRGVYLGPYYSYIHFERENNWNLNTDDINGDLTSNIDLKLNLVGLQLGYQFVIKNRLTLDLILMGPGIWFYNLETKLSTNLSVDDEALIFEKINEILAEKLPGKDILLKPVELEHSGSVKSSIPGFRYMISMGFRF